MGADVVVIDASLVTRTILSVCCRRIDATCHTFPDGKSALLALRDGAQAPPQVVVLELALPGIKGLDVVRLLRSSRRYDRTAIVILSSHDDLVHRFLARAAGAEWFVSKPFTRGIVVPLIMKCLTRDTGRPAEMRRPLGDWHEQTVSS